MSARTSKILAAAIPGVFFVLCAAFGARLLGVSSPAAVAIVTLGMAVCGAAAFLMLSSLRVVGTAGRCAAFFIPVLVLLLLRMLVFNYQTLDYQDFLAPWTQYFRSHGGLAAIGKNVGNYNVPYLVFLAICSYLPVSELYLIKLFSVFFDLVLAWALSKMVRRVTGSEIRTGLCFAVTLLLPTVFLNGALWGQCDSVYSSLALLSIALVLEEKPVPALIAAGVAFAFKLQAIFVLPMFAAFLFTGRVKWYHLPIFPAAYLAAVSPAIIAGRGFWDTVLTYLSDASTIGTGLNYNSPSVFAFITKVSDPVRAGRIGMLLSFAICAIMIIVVIIRRRNVGSLELVVCTAILAVGVPLFLPHMHDRYFFLADAAALAVAFCVPKLAIVAPLTSFASLLGYHAYLKMRYLLQMKWGFYALFIALIALIAFFIVRIARKNETIFTTDEETSRIKDRHNTM